MVVLYARRRTCGRATVVYDVLYVRIEDVDEGSGSGQRQRRRRLQRTGTQRVDGVRRLETGGQRLRQIGRWRPDAVVHGPEVDAADRVRLRADPEGVDGFE